MKMVSGILQWVTFLLFLTLKLTHVIAWSWWWVTAPLWAGAAIVILVVVITLPIYLAVENRK